MAAKNTLTFMSHGFELVEQDFDDLIVEDTSENEIYENRKYLDSNIDVRQESQDLGVADDELVDTAYEKYDTSVEHTMKYEKSNYIIKRDSLEYEVIEAFKAEENTTHSYETLDNDNDEKANIVFMDGEHWNIVEDNKEQIVDENFDTFKYEESESQENYDDEDDSGKFYCTDCEQVFSDYEAAENHNCNRFFKPPIADDTTNNRACVTCGNDFDTQHNLKKHQQLCKGMDTVPNRNYFLCSECPKKFNSIKALSRHAQAHKQAKEKTGKPIPSSNSNYYTCEATCEVCNTTFENYKNLRLHMKIHNKQRVKSIEDALPPGAKIIYKEMNQFFCEICNKSFESRLLEIHKNMHLNREEHICNICNRRFENLPSYEVHIQMHAGKPPKKRKVQETTERADGVRLPYKCQYCGYAFQRPFEKVKHERVHTGEKPYECEVCGKTFRVSYSLTLHLRTHTNIRPFVCATCKKRFKSKPAYDHHLNTHLPDRLYKCDICEKSFFTSVQLHAHKNCHNKPFNCPECNRPYASLYSVKMHMKTHIKSNKANINLRYRCAVCGAVYARVSALRMHLKDQHSLTSEDNITLQYVQELSVSENTADDNAQNEATNEEEMNTNMQEIVQKCFEEQDGNEEEIDVGGVHEEEIISDWLNK